jgi:ABC-type uncharacterized transport system permease subunit
MYAALPARRRAVIVGVLFLTAGSWVESAHAGVDTLEAYTLPLAMFLLAAGWWSRRQLGEVSWWTLGPGLIVALLPSALLTAADPGPVRSVLTATTAVAILLAGVARRWQAPVVVGAVTTVIVALTRLGPLTLQLPQYLTLGTLGIVLLAVGARYEQRRADARQALSWLASMT